MARNELLKIHSKNKEIVTRIAAAEVLTHLGKKENAFQILIEALIETLLANGPNAGAQYTGTTRPRRPMGLPYSAKAYQIKKRKMPTTIFEWQRRL
ncbi:hypothetical protein [Persicitalea sp.]|uniref:hypothetical protein n=1 Tax=Persicitalea sp. TaxID=3100273 RepID=UPI003593CD21